MQIFDKRVYKLMYRVKQLQEVPYSTHEAEAAGGVGSFETFKTFGRPLKHVKKGSLFDSGVVCGK